MKNIIIILSATLFQMQTLQAQQPRFTEFRTAEEKDSCTWFNKITTVETLKNQSLPHSD